MMEIPQNTYVFLDPSPLVGLEMYSVVKNEEVNFPSWSSLPVAGFIALQCFTLGSFLWLSTSHPYAICLTNLYCKLLRQGVFLSLQYLISYLWIRKLWQFRLLIGCFGFYQFKHKSLGILIILLNNKLIESSLKSGNVAFCFRWCLVYNRCL